MVETLTELPSDLQSDVERAGRISAIPSILEMICQATGMGFAAVARVTPDRWIACGVKDDIAFGLRAGGELPVQTTICDQIRDTRQEVIIDNVAASDDYCNHHTPALYGFQSYISIPIILADHSFFGTLCAIDPRPARLNNPETIGMFRLFADLISRQIEASKRLAASEAALAEERSVAGLREEFIAVLGHDLRNPVRAIHSLAGLLLRTPLVGEAKTMVGLIRDSSVRMRALLDNLMDFARGRLGGGLSLHRDADVPIEPVLRDVIDELRAAFPGRVVETDFGSTRPVNCDGQRIGQLVSNLLANAFNYGVPGSPVQVVTRTTDGSFELQVINHGPPIPMEMRDRLFHPFYRGTGHGSGEGLGLGLYIASEIASAHDGTLEFRSDAEETRFIFRMPSS